MEPEAIRLNVEDVYHEFGHILDSIDEPAILVDALCKDFPVVGVSRGFCQMTGFEMQEMKGRNCRRMFDGVPSATISRSSRKNVANFCEMCRVEGVQDLSAAVAVQPNARRDGSHFVNLFVLGLCQVPGRQLILGVQKNLGEGLIPTLNRSQISDETEGLRSIHGRIRHRLASSPLSQARLHSIQWPSSSPPEGGEAKPDFAFYSGRLQDHCMLLNNGLTVVRREPQELAFNCLTFGDRPVVRSSVGLRFTVRVDRVTDAFKGLPVLGFTKRQPTDSVDLFPTVGRCLGSSVLIGADAEAFARDQCDHFNIGFKKPPPEEVQHWARHTSGEPSFPKLTAGDLLQCTYSCEGWITLRQNGEVILEFDTGRPLDETSHYYAVVDVCLSAYSVTLVPSSSDDQAETLAQALTSTSTCDGLCECSDLPVHEGHDPADGRVEPTRSTGEDTEPDPARCGQGVSGLKGVMSMCPVFPLLAAPKLDNALPPGAGVGLRGSSDALLVTVAGLCVLAGTALFFPSRARR